MEVTRHRITLEPYPHPEPYDLFRSYPFPAPALHPTSHYPYPEPHSHITLTLEPYPYPELYTRNNIQYHYPSLAHDITLTPSHCLISVHDVLWCGGIMRCGVVWCCVVRCSVICGMSCVTMWWFIRQCRWVGETKAHEAGGTSGSTHAELKQLMERCFSTPAPGSSNREAFGLVNPASGLWHIARPTSKPLATRHIH